MKPRKATLRDKTYKLYGQPIGLKKVLDEHKSEEIPDLTTPTMMNDEEFYPVGQPKVEPKNEHRSEPTVKERVRAWRVMLFGDGSQIDGPVRTTVSIDLIESQVEELIYAALAEQQDEFAATLWNNE